MFNIYCGNWKSDVAFLDSIGLLKKGLHLLEIGSGTGWLLDYYKGIGMKMVGTEVNLKKISYAKKNLRIELLEMGGELLEFRDGQFDVVVSLDVFEHIPDTHKHVSEVWRVLKPGGTYAIATPNILLNVPFEVWSSRSFTAYRKYHCSLHTYWGLRRVLELEGFEVKFWEVPVVNEFFRKKVKKQFGKVGNGLIAIIPFDRMPLWMRTNFYVTAHKPILCEF